MSVTECPHCYARVCLTVDGVCPACRKNPAAPGADSSKTRMTIFEGRALPPVCFGCGNYTESTLQISRATSSGFAAFAEGAFKLIFGFLKILVLGFFSLFMESSGRVSPRIRLRFRVPWCLRCRSQRTPEIVWTDFEEGTVSMIVPKTVRDRVAPLN